MPWAAAGAVLGAGISAYGSSSAANTQASAARNASALQAQQQATTRADLFPYNTAGQTAERILQNSLYGGDAGVPNLLAANGFSTNATGGANLTFQPTQAQLEATPGYQFNLSQGLKSVQNSAAARGLGTSGAALKGAAQFATGLANNTLLTQQGIFQQNLANVLNPLMSQSQQGQNAANQTGTTGVTSAANQGAALIGSGNATAAGQVAATSAATNSPLNYQLYSSILNGNNGSGGGGGGGGNSFYSDTIPGGGTGMVSGGEGGGSLYGNTP